MLIISHRGYCKTESEKNTPAAFARSFKFGYGTETDLRDLAGRLTIAHDPPASDSLCADVFFAIYYGMGADFPLALNIKADGLQGLLMPLLKKYSVTNWFVFDMSVPDAFEWIKAGAPTFTRHSEEEREPQFYDKAAGVWLDSFTSDWWDAGVINRHLNAGKRVCVVSPDLHGRDPSTAWAKLVSADVVANPNLILCTDRPKLASQVLIK